MERAEIIKRIKEIAEPLRTKGATRLYIYGSRARDEARPDSDLDVFVDYAPGAGFSLIELAEIELLLEQHLGLDVHVKTRPRRKALREEIERDAIRVL
jgi:predicted nucleotidyltransferase